jgi:type III restriction-modification system, restriction endonuclease subunit
VYDSSNEKNFAMELDTSKDVAVYVKLPSGFYISTPVENTILTGRSRFMRAISSIFILWQRQRGL